MTNTSTRPELQPPQPDHPQIERAALVSLVASLAASTRGVAVVYLDLDRFHQVNTRWGQRTGDLLLAVLERRLRAAVAPEVHFSRIDGDAYIVVLPDAASAPAREMAERLLDLIARPVSVEGRVVAVRASAGIATRAGDNGAEALEEAFLACRRAKVARNGSIVEEVADTGSSIRRAQLESELARGIDAGELRLRYQPKVHLGDGTVVGVEALVRWQHPELGLIGPGAFIEMAEESGLVVPLGRWVLRSAIAQAAKWPPTIAGTPLRTWVNLSGGQLGDVAEIRKIILGAIDQGFDPRLIGFEVTESSLLADLDNAVEILDGLRALGAELALDDFGTGYSSLAYLRRLPVSSVKIDRAFVNGMDGSLADAAIVEAVVELAHALGIQVVAEGVEEGHQVEELIAIGADEAQGYWFSQPIPAEQLTAVMRQPWCGTAAPKGARQHDHRGDNLPGFGGPRSRLLMAALDSSADAVIVTTIGDIDSGVAPAICYANAAFEVESGYRSREVLGRPVWFCVHPDAEAERAQLREALSKRRAVTLTVPSVRSDGTRYLCELSVSPIRDERGLLTHWLHVRRDLSDRLELEADRTRLRRVVEQMQMFVALSDLDGQLFFMNQAARVICGMGPDEDITVFNMSDLVPAGARDQMDATIRPALRRDLFWEGAVTVVNRATAVDVPLWGDVRVVSDPTGGDGAYLAIVARDRRPELASRSAIEARDRWAEQLLAGTADGLLVVDRDGRITYANEAIHDLVGRRPPTLIGTQVVDHLAAEDVATALGVLSATGFDHDGGEPERRSGRPQRHRVGVQRHDGTTVAVEVVAVRRFDDPGIEGLLVSVRDLSTRDQNEQALRQQGRIDRFLAGCAQEALDSGPAGFLAKLDDYLSGLAREFGVDELFVDLVMAEGYRTLGHGRGGEVDPGHRENGRRGVGFVEPALLRDWIDTLEHDDQIVADDTFVEPASWHDEQQHLFGQIPRAVAVFALRVRGELLGAIGAVSSESPRRWTRLELETLARLGATVADVLERQRLDEALAASQQRLRTLIDRAGDGLVVVDRGGVVRFASAVFGRQLRRSVQSLTAVEFASLVHAADRTLVEGLLHSASTGGLDHPVTLRLVQPAGQVRWYEMTTTGGGEDPFLGGVVISVRDVTERQLAQQASHQRMQHLAMTFAVSQLALDLPAEEFLDRLDDVAADLGRLLDASLVLVDLLDDDRLQRVGSWPPPVQGSGLDTDDSGADNGSAQAGSPPVGEAAWLDTLRHLRPLSLQDVDGLAPGRFGAVTVIPMSAAGELLGAVIVADRIDQRRTDEDVAVVRIVAETMAAAVQRRKLDSALRASEARFRLLSETAADVVGLVDLDGIVTYVSPSIRQVLGHEPAAVTGRAFEELLVAEDMSVMRSLVPELVGGATRTVELRVRRGDGTVVWATNTANAVVDPVTGSVTGLRYSVRDVTERKRLEAELKRQALHDPLTGLANRTLLQSRLQVAAVRRDPNDLSVLVIDLDGFKQVNDGHGHSCGDRVLIEVANRLSLLSRAGDTLARTGGDEFVLLCPETDLAGAVAVAERVVESLAVPIVAQAVVHRIGASVGIAHATGRVEDPDQLLIEADRAMYRAKAAGRGRLHVADPRLPTLR